MLQLFQLSSLLQISCYIWLALPPMWTRTPIPAILAFGAGIGFSPFLLVVVVPQLVPLEYVSTTLGMHKSLEHTGTVIMQTLAGLELDTGGGGQAAIQYLLNAFLCLNVFQFMALMALAYLDRRKKAAAAVASIHSETISEDSDEDQPSSPHTVNDADNNEGADSIRLCLLPGEGHSSSTSFPTHSSKAKRGRRGELFAGLSLALIVLSWMLFLFTAWIKLRSKVERGALGVS